MTMIKKIRNCKISWVAKKVKRNILRGLNDNVGDFSGVTVKKCKLYSALLNTHVAMKVR